MRDFQISLAAGAVGEARIALDELRRLRRLDAVNLEFLQVRLHAEAEDWAAILAMDSLSDILNARRTTAVTRALISAVYRQEIARFETAGDARAALSHFRSNVWPLYAPLYESRRGLVEPDVVKSFMLAAIVDRPVRVAQAQELLDIGELGALDEQWLESLWVVSPPAGGLEGPEAGARALLLARENLDNRRYDDAVRLLSIQKPSRQVVGGLLECAYELRTNASEAIALDAYARLTKSDQDALNASRRYNHFLLEIGVGSALAVQASLPPQDWVGWLERCLGRETDETVLLTWANRGAEEWPIAPLAADTAKMAMFQSCLRRALDEDGARNVLLRVLPDLLSAFQADPGFPRPVFRSTYQALAEMLVLGTDGVASPAVLDAYVGLLQALLESGPSEDEYEDLLDGLEVLWGDGSAKTLPAAVDGVDVFMTYPCPKALAGHRAAAAARVLQTASLMRSNGRVDEASWNLAEVIADELGLHALLPSERGDDAREACSTDEQANDWQHLGGLVAVYTLSKQVGVRARQVLQIVAPQCTVKTNSDEVGTDALRDLAQKADHFVMITRSAKHAATDCIRSARGSRPIIVPEGKGMSSILRSLSERACS
jgi:hypothetical protein